MKKSYFLLLLATMAVQAQVPNGGFEEFIGYGNETRYWGATPFVLQVELDPNGTTTPVSDQIILEDGITSSVFYTNEAHSGDRAMEIRNAFNVTKNEVVAGKMYLFNENQGATSANGWNLGTEILPGMVVEGLGFYYKYFPLHPNDQAQAQLQTFDWGGTLLGTATVVLNGTATDYTYAAAPLQLVSDATAAYMTVEFSMATANGPTTFGNRLVVDDVVTRNLLLSAPHTSASAFRVTPTVTQNSLTITKGTTLAAAAYTFTILNMEGKVLLQPTISLTAANEATLDVSSLASGMYLITTKGFSGKFIKK